MIPTLAYLLALEESINLVQPNTIERIGDGQTLLVTTANSIQVLNLPSPEVKTPNVLDRQKLSNTLLQKAERSDLACLVQAALERLVQDSLSDCCLNEKLITFKLNNKPLSRTIDLGALVGMKPRDLHHLMVAARAVRLGYRVTEVAGGSLMVTTPLGLERQIHGHNCDCNDYVNVLRGKKPCQHLMLIRVYEQNRALFRQYGQSDLIYPGA